MVFDAEVVFPILASPVRRLNLGKNGVTSNGILSRAEMIATGADLVSSTRSVQAFSFTRPPMGSAAIWSSLFGSSAGPWRCERRQPGQLSFVGGEAVAQMRSQQSREFRSACRQFFQEQ